MTGESREQRLHAILHAYLQAVDRGDKPDRQKILDEHPDLREELAEYFADASKLERLAQSVRTASTWGAEAPAAATTAAAPVLGVVRYIGDYELLEEIARGGMGVVFKAKQVSLNRLVALKMILRAELATEADVHRFKQEAEAAANLDHPNIVPIYEVGEHEGQQYFSMKLIERQTDERPSDEPRPSGSGGEPLARSPRSLTVAARSVAARLAKVARAVHHAHQRSILHRDLKPSNILIDKQGEPHVADFGLAKRVEADSGVTKSGVIVGTPSYMAPEQARAEKLLTTAVDVYSLGSILYDWLTGRPPFRGDDVVSTLMMLAADEPKPPRSLNASIDRDLETVCLKCLEKDPAKRYGSAEALAEDLERWLRGEPIAARPAGRSERLWRWCRRNPVLAALTGAVAALVLAVAIGSTIAAIRIAKARDDARLAQDEAKKRLARQYVSNAVRAMDDSDLYGSLPWLVEALRQDEGKPQREAAQRLRLGTALRDCPKLTHLWFPPTRVVEMAFAGERLHVVTADGNKAQVWDALTGQPITPPLEHAKPVQSVTFRADGLRMVVGGGTWDDKDQALIVWDVPSGKKICTLESTKTECHTIRGTFTPDGKRILGLRRWQRDRVTVAAEAGIWDAETGKRLTPLHSYTDREESLLGWEGTFLSKDGERVVTMGQEGIWVWDANTGKTLSPKIPLPMSGPRHGAFSPDGRKVAVAFMSYDPPDLGGIGVWDIATGKAVTPLLKTASGAVHVSFAGDGRHIFALCFDSARRWWDLEHYERQQLSLPRDYVYITGSGKHGPEQSFSRLPWLAPNGIYTAVAYEKHLVVWNVVIQKPITPLLRHEEVVGLAVFDPEGCRLATTGYGMPVRVFDIGGLPPTMMGREYASMDNFFNAGSDPFGMNGQSMEGISTDGKRALLRVWPGASQLWDLDAEKPANPAQYVEGMSMSDVGERCLLLKSRQRTDNKVEFRVGNVATGKSVSIVVDKVSDEVRTHGFPSEDGRWLMIEGARDGSQVWNAETGQKLVTLPLAVATYCTPDGGTLIGFDKDGGMHAWQLPGGGLLWSTQPVAPKWPWPLDWQMPHVRFSQDSQSVLLARHEGDEDNPLGGDRPSRLAIWDVRTGKRLFEPIRLTISFYPRYALSPDGQRLFVLDGDNTARVWNARTGELLASWKPDSPGEPSFSEDSKKIILVSTATRETRLWNPVQGRPLCPPLAGHVSVWSADTQMAFVSFPQKKGQPWFAASGSRVLETETGLPLTPFGEDSGNSTHFRPDGKRMTMITMDHLLRRHNLVSEERSIDDLKTLAAALSRHQIDETGGFVFMDRPAYEKAWLAFKAKRLPSDVAFTPRQRREWHVQAALDCIGALAWEGALHHLDIVLSQEPGNAMLHFMRAQAWRYLGQEDKQLAELNKAVALEPRCRKLWEDRAMLHLRLGEEAKAAVDFARVLDIGSDNFHAWQHLALLHLTLGKTEEYSTLCQRMLDNLKPAGFFDPAEVLLTCALHPKGVDPARLLALAPDPKVKEDHGSLKQVAIALHRAGQHAEAAKFMDRSLKQGKEGYPPLAGSDFAWAALIFHKAGRKEDRDTWRREADAWRDKEGKGAPWIYRAEFDLLSRELRGVLEKEQERGAGAHLWRIPVGCGLMISSHGDD